MSSKQKLSPLPLREINGNLVYTADSVIAWYRLPPQRWSFLTDEARETHITNAAAAYAALASELDGARLHLRVTSRQYDVAGWSRGLDRNSRPIDPEAWGARLDEVQRYLHRQAMSETEVYLGVTVHQRTAVSRLRESLNRDSGARERRRFARLRRRVDDIVGGPGLDGRPASSVEMQRLLHHSVAPHVAAPALFSAAGVADWDDTDLTTFTDHVEIEQDGPFGLTSTVRAWRDGGCVERHVAVLTIGRMQELIIPEKHDPWMAYVEKLPFPVEWSAHVNLLTGQQAQSRIIQRIRAARDQQAAYREHGLDQPPDLGRKAEQAQQVWDEMLDGHESVSTRAYGHYRLIVGGRDQDQTIERAQAVRDAYRKLRIDVEHPRDQESLLRELVPGASLGPAAHVRRMPVRMLAAGVPTMTAACGDRRGPYRGYTCGTSRRPVFWDPHYAIEQRENTGLSAVTGALGSGKSVFIGSVAYDAALAGVTTTVFDPSGPMSALARLPEVAPYSRHVDLLHGNDGVLSPYAAVPEPDRLSFTTRDAYVDACKMAKANRRVLATDVMRMLLPPQVIEKRDDVDLLLNEATREADSEVDTSLWDVVDALRGHGDYGKVLANYLEGMAELPRARLFFPSSDGQLYTRAGNDVLMVLTMAGIEKPVPGTDPKYWSMEARLAVPLLHLAAHFATRRVYGRDMGERKLITLDEAHFIGQWSSGRALFDRLAHDSRKWNTRVLVASQQPDDVLGLDVAGLVGEVFVGKTTDEKEAGQALRLLRLHDEQSYRSALGRLSPPSGDGRSGYREFVMRDADSRVEKVRIDLSHNPELLRALDTTAVLTDGDGRHDDDDEGHDGAVARAVSNGYGKPEVIA